MRIWSLIFLLTISIPTINATVSFDVDKVGVNDGDRFNLLVVNVEGNFRESTSQGKKYNLEVVNANVTPQNTIIVRDSVIGNLPIFMDEFGSWIVFTDWDNWDVYWEIEKSQNSANYSVEIFHSRDEFKVITETITTYTNPAISEFNKIIERQESTYIKETGIATELIIHQDLSRFDGGSSQNEIVISNVGKQIKGNVLTDFVNQFGVIELLTLGIVGYAIAYPSIKARRKRQTNLQINQGWN